MPTGICRYPSADRCDHVRREPLLSLCVTYDTISPPHLSDEQQPCRPFDHGTTRSATAAIQIQQKETSLASRPPLCESPHHGLRQLRSECQQGIPLPPSLVKHLRSAWSTAVSESRGWIILIFRTPEDQVVRRMPSNKKRMTIYGITRAENLVQSGSCFPLRHHTDVFISRGARVKLTGCNLAPVKIASAHFQSQ